MTPPGDTRVVPAGAHIGAEESEKRGGHRHSDAWRPFLYVGPPVKTDRAYLSARACCAAAGDEHVMVGPARDSGNR